MAAAKTLMVVMMAGLCLMASAAAAADSGFDDSGDEPRAPARPPQAYFVPDQDELQTLPAPPPGQDNWGWLRRAFSGPSRLDPGRDDPQHDPNLDQGP
ncbi:MAG: hypothetical protein LDL07_10650 [Desulfarculus sp.]|nr:hypothetical protein [Desulfarculus sp.]